jgi:glycosyltransferase involved in cell wall biosynthesis
MVVIPSLYEGIPLTLFESAALGKPIITSSLPGICEVMTDEHTCLMSPPGDTKGLADSIMRLLSDENLRQEIGKNAKRIVEKNYTWDHIAEKTMKVYQKLLQ